MRNGNQEVESGLLTKGCHECFRYKVCLNDVILDTADLPGLSGIWVIDGGCAEVKYYPDRAANLTCGVECLGLEHSGVSNSFRNEAGP